MKKFLLSFILLTGTIASAQQVFWEQKATGALTTSTSQGQISYADANTVWTYATAGDGSGAYYHEFGLSLDGGETWTTGTIDLGSADLIVGSIQGMSATKAYVTCWQNGTLPGGVYVTNDAGATWQKQASALFNTATESFPDFLHFWDANNGIAVGDPASGYFEIYTTTDGGANWNRVPSSNIATPLASEYGYTHEFEVSGTTIWFSTNKGRIYRSVDGGANWTAAQSPLTDFGSATQSGNYSFKDSQNGLLTSSDSQFFRTTDGGDTWVSEAPVGYFRSFNICYVPGTVDTYISTGVDPDAVGRGSSYTTDGGLNWFDMNTVDILPVNGGGTLTFFDATHGLTSGFSADSVTGGIWKWINDATTLGVNTSAVTNSISATPNPATNNLNVAGKNIANVSVFDLLGKQVMNNNFNTLNEVNLNVSELNRGIYMLKVTNDLGNTTTLKVVKQ